MRATLLLFVIACEAKPPEEPDLGPPPAVQQAAVAPSQDVNPRLLRRFRALRYVPATTPEEIAEVALGKMLFFEKRLSRNGDVSCNSCHQLEAAGTDRRKTSVGTAGRVGKRNAPSVLNAQWHFAQFWDGRVTTLEEQAKGPITNPDEMAMHSPEEVTRVLHAIPGYVSAFEHAYPGAPLDFDHVARAIAAFERTLVTPARWDKFLDGDRTALTRAEIEGVKVFADIGCVQCHTGLLVGGSMFQKVGLVEPWPNQADQGRYEITKQDADRMVFKVPSLRNVTLTAPYFHDGSVADLREAVREMAHYQLGSELSEAEITSIVTWLGALTGDMPKIEAPQLP
jgi:cytochrome c peroxidase